MTFEELGNLLRTEREKRQLNLDDVANQLKINPRQLRALETGDASSLPHPAYVRGFIRSYAALLGISQDEILAALNSIQPEMKPGQKRRPVQPEFQPRPEKLEQDPDNSIPVDLPAPVRRSGRGLTLLIILVLLGAGGYWAWSSGLVASFLPQPQKTAREIAENLPRADNVMAARDAARPAPSEPPKEKAPSDIPQEAANHAVQMESGNKQDVPDASAQTDVATASESSMPANKDVETPPLQEPVAEKTAPENEQHKLVIIATEECWVHSNADKSDTRQFSLRKGDTFALTFGKTLELKLGNAGGVRLRYDGQDLPSPGTSGQVRTLVFPPAANP